jgi:hypothetical protein
MLRTLRQRLTYANVMSTLAVFLALGGGVAWALANNSVKSKHIVNEQVKAQDIANGDPPSSAGEDAVNASYLGGEDDDDYVSSNGPTDVPDASEMSYSAFFLDTATTGSSFSFGPTMAIENTGTADEFRVCAGASGTLAASVYVGGARTQVSVPTSSCSADFTIPDDGDFSVSGDRAQVFGVFSGNSEDLYVLYALRPG